MATTHPVGEVPSGLCCLCTFEDISVEDENYCEYRTYPSGRWHVSLFGVPTIKHLLQNSFQKYLSDVEKASKDCAAAVRRLINKGPPVFISDKTALPIPEGDEYIDRFWFSNGEGEVESKLLGALEGEEREELWNTQREALQAMEEAEAL